jgi:hypothetical protein
MKARLLGMAVAAVMGLVLAGCGGGTTTIIERTVTAEAQSNPPAKPALLKLPTYENWTIEPRIYSFSVDGSLAGHELTWEGWGTPRATGKGPIWERDGGPVGPASSYRKYPGTVVATELQQCEGREFYKQVVVQVPAGSVYGPQSPVELDTPCTGGAPFDESAVTTRRDDEERERQTAEEEAEQETSLQHCGNPPNWSGSLEAYGISCEEAAQRFEAIHCDDQSCTRRHSGDWSCSIEPAGRYTTRGICQKGDRFLRYTVHE